MQSWRPTFTHYRWFEVGGRFVTSWLAGGVIVWWLLPRLFWVRFQGLILTQLLILGYLMAWSLRVKAGSAPAQRALIIGAFAAPLGLLLNLAVLNIEMKTPVTSAPPVPAAGIMAWLALFIVGGFAALALGAFGSAIAVMVTSLPHRQEQGSSKTALSLKIALGILGLVLLVFLVQGWPGENAIEARASPRLSERDAGRTVELRSHTQFDIVLEGYPTGGYGWEWVEADWNIVGGGASNYRRDWGDGGQTWFHAWANNPGRTPIRIVYRRGPNTPPVKTFEVEILVR